MPENLCRQIPFEEKRREEKRREEKRREEKRREEKRREEKRREEKTREEKTREERGGKERRGEERRGEKPTLLLLYSQINVFCDQIFNGVVNQFAIISVRKIRQLVGVIYSSSLEQVNLRIA